MHPFYVLPYNNNTFMRSTMALTILSTMRMQMLVTNSSVPVLYNFTPSAWTSSFAALRCSFGTYDEHDGGGWELLRHRDTYPHPSAPKMKGAKNEGPIIRPADDR